MQRPGSGPAAANFRPMRSPPASEVNKKGRFMRTLLCLVPAGIRACLFVVLACLLIAPSAAVLAQVNEVRDIDIPAQALDSALRQLASTQNLQILFAPDDVKGIATKGVRGRISIQAAADKLIEETGLIAVSNGKNAVTIRPAATADKADKKKAGTPGASNAGPTIMAEEKDGRSGVRDAEETSDK